MLFQRAGYFVLQGIEPVEFRIRLNRFSGMPDFGVQKLPGRDGKVHGGDAAQRGFDLG
jgi:hypothetical protein